MDEYNKSLFFAAKSGNLDAFGEFIYQYEKFIYNTAYKVLLNSHDAEDAAQDAIIKAFTGIKGCKSPEAFKVWLYRIVVNTCTDQLRKRKNRPYISLDGEQEEGGPKVAQYADPGLSPEYLAVQKETQKEVQAAINQLNDRHKLLLILRDINGLSYEEIAKIQNISMGTVKSRISRARAALKDILC